MTEHHAYLCRNELSKSEIIQAITERFGSSDIRDISADIIGINDTRSIIEQANVRPTSGTHQLVIINARSIRVEAQHALLKILEEPPASSLFLVCVPSDCYLLPTLLSRFYVHNSHGEKIFDTNTAFEDFSKLSYKERIEQIKKRLDKKDLAWVEEIKKGLLVKLSSAKKDLKRETLTNLVMVAENLNTRGASNKFLLEELALSLPTDDK